MSRSRAEAIAAGVKVREVEHSMNRRLASHNYRGVGTYMLTLVVAGRMPVFGRLKGDGFVPPGAAGAPYVELSELGRAVLDREIRKISTFYPMVEVWKICIMPDHIHLIVRVKDALPEGKHLGHVVSGFKGGCSRAWWGLLEGGSPCGKPQGTEAASGSERASGSEAGPSGLGAASGSSGAGASVPGGFPAGGGGDSRRPGLFEKGYCDKILLREGQLGNWKRYLDDNPRRLAIKRQCPEYFTILHQVRLMDLECQMVGNRFLLDIPERAAVIVHRAYSDADFEHYRQQWLALGEAGGVLISAAIAPREKAVMREAMDRGYRLILLLENGFPPLYKPSGEAFDACSDGRLLQISPWPYHSQRRVISREQCLLLNRLAEYLAEYLAMPLG